MFELWLTKILSFIRTSCSPVKSESSNKNAFDEYGILKEQEIDWDDCLSQIEERYIVFFHSDTCGHCDEIMGDVLAFSHENITKTYFVDVNKNIDKIKTCSKEDLTIGVEDINDLAIIGTPSIIEVFEGMTIANVPGKESCLSFLNEQRLNYKM